MNNILQSLNLLNPKNRSLLMFGLAIISVIAGFILLVSLASREEPGIVDEIPEIKEINKSNDGKAVLYDNGDNSKTIVVEGDDYSKEELYELFDLQTDDVIDIYLKKDNVDYSEFGEEEINLEEWGLEPGYNDDHD